MYVAVTMAAEQGHSETTPLSMAWQTPSGVGAGGNRGVAAGGSHGVTVGTLQLRHPLCVGTMQWGCTRLDHKLNRGTVMDSTVDAMLDTMAGAGLTFMDTAEGYGGGSSEERVGCAIQRFAARHTTSDEEAPQAVSARDFVVGSKFLPTPWRYTRGSFLKSVRHALRRVGLPKLPLFMLHTPTHPVRLETWIHAACDAADAGLIENIGVSNCDAGQVRRACAVAQQRGRRIVVNQVLFCLLDYGSAKLQEMERTCRELGVTIMGYGPLVREADARSAVVSRACPLVLWLRVV